MSNVVSTGAAVVAAGSLALAGFTYFSLSGFEPTIDGNCYFRDTSQGNSICLTASAAETGNYCVGLWKAAPPCPAR